MFQVLRRIRENDATIANVIVPALDTEKPSGELSADQPHAERLGSAPTRVKTLDRVHTA